MSGTKYAPATLSSEEQARIRQALEEAARINEILDRAAAATALCRDTIDGLDAGVRGQLERVVARTEEARQEIEGLRADVALDVQQVQDGLNRAAATQRARALPVLSTRVRQMAQRLDEDVRALEEQTQQIGRLAESVAAGEASAERFRARRRRALLASLLQRLRSRLETDSSFQWVADDARQAIEDSRRQLDGDVADADCALLERRLELLCDRAFESERLYHERRRTADLVRTLFASSGFEVSSIADPPHGSTAEIASSFRTTEEHLLATVVARHPWEQDEQRRQLLHLTMSAPSTFEESTDPFCVDRLKDFARRARELGIEIGDVLQPLPGGGYECVLSAESVLAGEHASDAADTRTRERRL